VRRLLAAIHPFAMRKLEGNQVVNSLVAIAHGGMFGVGLGNSSQKLGYLPEPYTDFILAVITEELGLIGAIVIIGLIFFLILRFYLLGVRAQSSYHALIAYGIATMMLIQTTFNVGAVVGLLPVTGVTLPFISYGGSSMFVLCAAIGIMLNISATQKRAKEKKVGVKHA
jgi:cell division protein FtsW